MVLRFFEVLFVTSGDRYDCAPTTLWKSTRPAATRSAGAIWGHLPYEGYLGDHGYALSTKGGHLRCLVHYGRWMSQCGLNAENLEEEVVA